MWDLFLTVYGLKIAVDGALCAQFKRVARQYPAFFAYLAFGLLKSLILFPLISTHHQALASDVGWPLSMIEVAIKGMMVGELCGFRLIGALYGLSFALCMGNAMSHSDAAGLMLLDRGFGVAVCIACLMAILLLGKNTQLGTGVIVATLFPAIIQVWHVHVDPQAYVFVAPTVRLMASVIWLRWLRSVTLASSGQSRPAAAVPRSTPRGSSLSLPAA